MPTLTVVPTHTLTPSASATPTASPTSSATATLTASATPTTSALLVGHVSWQGRPAQPNALQALPITLTLRLQSGGPDLEYADMTTDASGFFTVDVGSLSGIYNWRVKSAQVGPTPQAFPPGWLATFGTVALTGWKAGRLKIPSINLRTFQPSNLLTINVEMGLQASGDCDNNNLVSVPDFIILKNAFGKSVGQPGYDNRADITGDTVVSSADFIQLKNNFGFSGAPPIGPYKR